MAWDTREEPLVGRYTGATGGFLMLNIRTALLTLVTLGLYRFWARTRIRRYVWSATSPDGDPFEYTGTGLEKLLGFLIAVVVLGVVLGLMQILLFYAGMSFFNGARTEAEMALQIGAFQMTALVIVPLVFIARYRARRYMLARTRWRGIRFGVENGAIDYMLRAIGHSLLTAITLGILLPRQTYYLQKFMIDRTWYGNRQFALGGNWHDLWPAMINFFVGIAIMVLGAVGMAFNPLAGFIFALGYVWFFVGIIAYRVHAYAILTGLTTLGEGITFKAIPSALSVIGRIVLGGIVVGLLAAVAFAGYGALLAVAGLDISAPEDLAFIPPATAGVAVIGALLLLAFLSALSRAFIVQPIIRHIVTSTAVMTPSGLALVRQREGDEVVDADGFADALDVGAAI